MIVKYFESGSKVEQDKVIVFTNLGRSLEHVSSVPDEIPSSWMVIWSWRIETRCISSSTTLIAPSNPWWLPFNAYRGPEAVFVYGGLLACSCLQRIFWMKRHHVVWPEAEYEYSAFHTCITTYRSRAYITIGIQDTSTQVLTPAHMQQWPYFQRHIVWTRWHVGYCKLKYW